MKGSPDCGCEAALQQYENSPLMRNRAIGDAVKKDPCIRNTLHPFNNSQLVFKSQWMKDFEEVFGALLNVALFPAVCEIVNEGLLVTSNLGAFVF